MIKCKPSHYAVTPEAFKASFFFAKNEIMQSNFFFRWKLFMSCTYRGSHMQIYILITAWDTQYRQGDSVFVLVH